MNCIESKKEIGALLDGELSNARRLLVEDHLLTCANCRETREWTQSLSSLLQDSRLDPPSKGFDERVTESFRQHYSPKWRPVWQRIALGSLVIPKPAFATILVLAFVAPWFAFQIGKINATAISIPKYVDAISTSPAQMPDISETKTVVVRVPILRERIIMRTLYVQTSKKNKKGEDERKTGSESNILSSYSSAQNGYFTDISLKGFQPPAEIGVQIIKEEKRNEK